MNAPSVDIKDYIIANGGLSLVFGTNMFIGMEPSTPVSTVTVFDTFGAPPDLFYDRDIVYEKPSIQIRVRALTYLEGYNMIKAIRDLLHNRAVTINTTSYALIRCSQEPGLLDRDENDHPRFVTSFDIQRH